MWCWDWKFYNWSKYWLFRSGKWSVFCVALVVSVIVKSVSVYTTLWQERNLVQADVGLMCCDIMWHLHYIPLKYGLYSFSQSHMSYWRLLHAKQYSSYQDLQFLFHTLLIKLFCMLPCSLLCISGFVFCTHQNWSGIQNYGMCLSITKLFLQLKNLIFYSNIHI